MRARARRPHPTRDALTCSPESRGYGSAVACDRSSCPRYTRQVPSRTSTRLPARIRSPSGPRGLFVSSGRDDVDENVLPSPVRGGGRGVRRWEGVAGCFGRGGGPRLFGRVWGG